NDADKHLITAYSDSSPPKQRHRFMSLLLNIYTDIYPDVMREMIRQTRPGEDIIQPDRWDTGKHLFLNKKAISGVKREFQKVKTEHIKDIEITLVPVKHRIDVNYSSIVHDCLGENEETLYEEDFYLYRILIKGSGRIDGYIYVAERTVDDEKIWILPGIQPAPDIDMDQDAFLEKLLDALEGQAGARGVNRILLPKDTQYRSNREGMKRAIERAGFKEITLKEAITFPHKGSPAFTLDSFLLAREVKTHGKNKEPTDGEEQYHPGKACIPDETDIPEIARKLVELGEKELGIPGDEFFRSMSGMGREEFFIQYCARLRNLSQLIVVKDRHGKIIAFLDVWLLNSDAKEKVKARKAEDGLIPKNITAGVYAYIPSAYVAAEIAEENGVRLIKRMRDFVLEQHPCVKMFCAHRRGNEWHEAPANGKNKPEQIPQAKRTGEAIHMKNLEFSPEIREKHVLCHIIADSILPEGQLQVMQELEQEMRKDKYREKIVGLTVGKSEDFMTKLKEEMARQKRYYEDRGYVVDFDVAVDDLSLVDRVRKELNTGSLAFQGSDGDFIHVEGIVLALRALHAGELHHLKQIFELITGNKLSGKQTNITDLNKFARSVLFRLPRSEIQDYQQLKDLNDNLKKFIQSAA
ncbi:MAG: hypothetical protein KAS86_02370, partial [Candidatus Omnitrophica bacterium]|nr:hypothetical protein [Candidatus Omnitrophota bacterium]